MTVINEVHQQDRLAEVAADGSFTLKLNGEDNVIADIARGGSGQVEKHVLTIYWLWNDKRRDPIGLVPGSAAGHEDVSGGVIVEGLSGESRIGVAIIIGLAIDY